MEMKTIIRDVQPEIDNGKHYIKRVPGEPVEVTASIFCDGYDDVRANLCYKLEEDKEWKTLPFTHRGNDEWIATFYPKSQGYYLYTIEAWTDPLASWLDRVKSNPVNNEEAQRRIKQEGVRILRECANTIKGTAQSELLDLANLLDQTDEVQEELLVNIEKVVEDYPFQRRKSRYANELRLKVERPKALFSTWYQLFPRSTSQEPATHGRFSDVERILPRISGMGFDVLSLTPIHPIGESSKDQSYTQGDGEVKPMNPGSPWAIGSKEGGHEATHPDLGSMEDFKQLIAAAGDNGMELALDLSFQASLDHPWVSTHPDWFICDKDGQPTPASIPGKFFPDMVRFNFDTPDWKNLWDALLEVTLIWVKAGVKIIRADAPQTKPFNFWAWLIREVEKVDRDVIFLSTAFTRPKLSDHLAKLGFSQSFTFFIWQTEANAMRAHVEELMNSQSREYLRPNFVLNTPDILPKELMGAKYPAFAKRFVLAATLSSNYGLYGPSYEFMENVGSETGIEGYRNSEKYEIRHYGWTYYNKMTNLITQINALRAEHPALQTSWNIQFTDTDNEQLLSYIKWDDAKKDWIWCIVNFDTENIQSGYVQVPKQLLGIKRSVQLAVTDLLNGETYRWFNEWNYVELNPKKAPAHILSFETKGTRPTFED